MVAGNAMDILKMFKQENEQLTKKIEVLTRELDRANGFHESAAGKLFNSEQKCKQLKAQVKDLINRNAILRQRPDLPVDRIPAIVEMDRLKAQVNELRASITREAAFVLRERFGIEDEDCEERLRLSACRLIDTRKKSSTQSLTEHDAALLECVAQKLCGDAELPSANGWVKKMIFDEAAHIRQQALEK